MAVPAMAETKAPIKAHNVVLVHGLYADGSSWSEVIPLLQKAGLHDTAVQNPLTSFKDDVDATDRILAQQDGPTVLVGHSYGGAVISETGDDPKVSALVYIAARAPEAGEDFAALGKTFPATPASQGTIHEGGFAQLSEKAFIEDFVGDLPVLQARALYAVQGPASDSLYTVKTTKAAWHSKPSWYAVSQNDKTSSPDLERFLAKRMGATTVELASSHVSMLSHAQSVANLILEAAGYRTK
ncbi:alpha/beta fold hydrolase [Rhizobium sp. B21/90]|uniref:alpha/beta fold hydrolase n=1 Tax=Rhizobium sp. B21/90 TaxID=2819993 RepID=UPI001C5A9E2E|nr:alpha/beta hydrolase [Rhizobium sp. B21/90]QYA04827.1 alpha/beta hydrolase [Rhizobium sp. B21/90]